MTMFILRKKQQQQNKQINKDKQPIKHCWVINIFHVLISFKIFIFSLTLLIQCVLKKSKPRFKSKNLGHGSLVFKNHASNLMSSSSFQWYNSLLCYWCGWLVTGGFINSCFNASVPLLLFTITDLLIGLESSVLYSWTQQSQWWAVSPVDQWRNWPSLARALWTAAAWSFQAFMVEAGWCTCSSTHNCWRTTEGTLQIQGNYNLQGPLTQQRVIFFSLLVAQEQSIEDII